MHPWSRDGRGWVQTRRRGHCARWLVRRSRSSTPNRWWDRYRLWARRWRSLCLSASGQGLESPREQWPAAIFGDVHNLFKPYALVLAARIEEVHRCYHILLQYPVDVRRPVRQLLLDVHVRKPKAVKEDNGRGRIGHARLAIDRARTRLQLTDLCTRPHGLKQSLANASGGFGEAPGPGLRPAFDHPGLAAIPTV